MIISPSSAFMSFALHCRDLIIMYRSWSVPSSFLEDGHITSGKNVTLSSCSVRVRLQPYLLWNWLTKVFSWIEIMREKNKISAYGSFLSVWHPPPSPVDRGANTSNHSSRGFFEKEKGRQKENQHPLFCCTSFPRAPPCSLPSLNCLGLAVNVLLLKAWP